MSQRWATLTMKLSMFFIGDGVNFNRNGVELEWDLRIYRVEFEWNCCLFATTFDAIREEREKFLI